MGYYSDYKITPMLLPAELTRLVEISKGVHLVNYDNATRTDDRWKWYEHQSDMATFSKEFPHTTWKLVAHGEDGEKWAVFTKNGKTTIVRQTPYDPPTPTGF